MSEAASPLAQRYLRQDMEEPQRLEALGGQIVVFTTRCPGNPDDNEDAAAVIDLDGKSGVLLVADGMGGGAAGEEASRRVVQSIQSAATKAAAEDIALRTVILNGIEAANRSILDVGIGAASTLAAVEFQGEVIRPYHVGDAAVVVCGQRGKIKLRTVSHGPVGHAVAAGMIDDDEALNHEDLHLVSNVVGAEDMRIEIGPSLRLARYDTVLLATDGLYDNLSVAEIVQRVRKGPLLRCVKQLVAEVHERMQSPAAGTPSKPDDLTLIAFRLGRSRK